MNSLEGVLGAAAEVEGFCRSRGWRFCLIGGIAVQRWGAPRFTQDVDLTLLKGFGGEAVFVDALLQHYAGRMRGARQFALELKEEMEPLSRLERMIESVERKLRNE